MRITTSFGRSLALIRGTREASARLQPPPWSGGEDVKPRKARQWAWLLLPIPLFLSLASRANNESAGASSRGPHKQQTGALVSTRASGAETYGGMHPFASDPISRPTVKLLGKGRLASTAGTCDKRDARRDRQTVKRGEARRLAFPGSPRQIGGALLVHNCLTNPPCRKE